MISSGVLPIPDDIPAYELGLAPGSQLLLYFQPKANALTDGLCGAEALLRAIGPDGALVLPDDFIPAIERNGRMPEIGALVLRQSCYLAAQLNRTLRNEIRISVNVSLSQLAPDKRFAECVRQALAGSGLDARLLELEVTESLMANDFASLRASLDELRSLGARVLIDDFGTGYSSLLMLQNAPIDALKIDKSFMLKCAQDPTSRQIVQAISNMAQGFELDLVAEGVETPEQLEIARNCRIGEIQGWIYAKAMPFAEFAQFAASSPQLPARRIEQKGMLLLIVDDEPAIASSLRRCLHKEGYEIVCKSSGQEALEFLASRSPDAIISDQRMPGMSGSEFLAKARIASPNSTRIILSGYSDLDSVVSSINDGRAWKYLSKPWDDGALRLTVREAIKISRAKKDNEELRAALAQANGELNEANLRLAALLDEKNRLGENLSAGLSRMQKCFDLAPAALAGLDDDGMIAMLNSRACALLGATPVGSCARAEGFDPEACQWNIRGRFFPCLVQELGSGEGSLVHIYDAGPARGPEKGNP